MSVGIRIFQRAPYQRICPVNHCAIVVAVDADGTVWIVEANPRGVERTRLDRYADGKHEVAIYRPINVSPAVAAKMAAYAETFVYRKNADGTYSGERYGYARVFEHWLDNTFFGGLVVFRRIPVPGRVICSQLLARVCSKFGLHFGVEPESAEPDEIWFFENDYRDKYECVFRLGPLPRAA